VHPGSANYSIAPLITSEGEALGTLCVIDYVPRELTSEQQDALQILSRHVMAQLELRQRLTDFTRGDLPRRKAITALRLERRSPEESAARHSSASQ
jgi:GAF domain-containing protein